MLDAMDLIGGAGLILVAAVCFTAGIVLSNPVAGGIGLACAAWGAYTIKKAL